MYHKIIRRIFTFGILAVGLSAIAWGQTRQLFPAPALAQDFSTDLSVSISGPTSVTIDDTFQIAVVADNIPAPGIFGYQFTLHWDSTIFTPLNVTTNPDFPIMVQADLWESAYEIAASREGEVSDMMGPLTLLTVELRADAVTEADSFFYLTDVKFGRRGGLAVPVVEISDLAVGVTDLTTGDIVGNITVEGRLGDNQAGHIITNGADLFATSGFEGSFSLASVAPGSYTLTADSPGFLAATCQNVTHGTELTILNRVLLLAGDINGDDIIDITDATAMGNVFNSDTPGEPADLNADSLVDVLDLVLMAANFRQSSADNPWVCQ